MPRKTVTVLSRASLAADSDTVALLGTSSVELQRGGEISIQCVVDNGAGAAPTDTPIGVWELYSSGTGTEYSPVELPQLTAALATIAPSGNVKISRWVTLRGVPGKFAKMRYKATSGGASSSRCFLGITTDDDD